MFPLGKMPKPRSPSPPPPPVRLTIRTALQPTQPPIQQAQVSSPSQQGHPSYPIPIPPEKQDKALKLYIAYKFQETLAASSQLEPPSAISYNDGYHLSVPGPSVAHSVTSQNSSTPYRAASVTTSNYDGVTDLSSVVSFEDESPSSAKARTQGKLVAFDGKEVRQRTRKRLTPVTRAKAALVRWLGSCLVCRSRRVKVSIISCFSWFQARF